MHRYTQQHAFTPVLHQSSASFPMMQPHHTDFNQPRPAVRHPPSSSPVAVFHRATQKPFKSAKRGRWGALHACIAWQIYYHKQLKKMQPKANSPHQELSCSLLDTVQHQEPEQRSHLDSTCGQPAYGERSEIGKTTENQSHLNDPPDYHTSSSASSYLRVTEEQLGQSNWKGKMEEKLDSSSYHGRRDTASRGRNRPIECDSFANAKRVKQEVEDDRFDPCLGATRTDVSSHATSAPHMNTSDALGLYCMSGACNVVSSPGVELHPYQTASWEHAWNGVKQMNHSLTLFPEVYLQNGYKVIRMLPCAVRQQETPQLSRRKLMNRHHVHHCCHSSTTAYLPHSGFLAASYMGL